MNLTEVIREMDFTLSDIVIEDKKNQCLDAITNGTYDFSRCMKDVFTQGRKKRRIYHFAPLSVEDIITHYLKKQIDKNFKIRYSGRNKIICSLFNTLAATKDMNDFVIVRADFKSFFDSVLSKFVFDKFVLESRLIRSDKDILEKYVSEFEYCYAGLCLSNGFTEIVCREFDKKIQARLDKHGLFFYERYVDDMIIMLNMYLSESKIKEIINETIRDVFGECPVELSSEPGKFAYISRRDLRRPCSFSFLGYEYCVIPSGKKISFKFGITEKKRNKYFNIIERAFIEYKKTSNEELLRQRVKLFSSRVVIARKVGNTTFKWLTKGVVSNYNELRNYEPDLNDVTRAYLNDIFYDILKKQRIKRPYFIEKSTENKESRYNLMSSMRHNRTLLFEEEIGVPKKVIIAWIQKLLPTYGGAGKDYYQVVMDYLDIIKIG